MISSLWELRRVEHDQRVDVVAIVDEVGELISGRTGYRREVRLLDDSNTAACLVLWEGFTEAIRERHKGRIVTLSEVRVAQLPGGTMLSFDHKSRPNFKATSERVEELEQWSEHGEEDETGPELLSRNAILQPQNYLEGDSSVAKALDFEKEALAQPHRDDIHLTIRRLVCHIFFVDKNNTVFYKTCPVCCEEKKLNLKGGTDANDEYQLSYKCETCGTMMNEEEPTLGCRILVRVADKNETGEIGRSELITFFGEAAAVTLFGKTLTELSQMAQMNLEEVLDSAQDKYVILNNVKIKSNSFNVGARPDWTVNDVQLAPSVD